MSIKAKFTCTQNRLKRVQLELLTTIANLALVMAHFHSWKCTTLTYSINYLPILVSGLQFFGASGTRTEWPHDTHSSTKACLFHIKRLLISIFWPDHHLALVHQNDQHKVKEERHPLYVFQAFQKAGSGSFGHMHVNLQERWYCRLQGNGHSF